VVRDVTRSGDPTVGCQRHSKVSLAFMRCWQSNANLSPLFAGEQVPDNENFGPFSKGGVS
jgi:hypothetical protein